MDGKAPKQKDTNNNSAVKVWGGPGVRLRWLSVIIILLVAVIIGLVIWLMLRGDANKSANKSPNTAVTGGSTEAPALSSTVVLDGRAHIWGIAFLPTEELVFTERNGTVSLLKDGNVTALSGPDDVRAIGEGGLMGLAVDPNYAENKYIYTCFNSTKSDIRVVRWELKGSLDKLEGRTDIVTGMPSNPGGRHSGCQLAFGPDGYLWIGTGDSAQQLTPQTPQDPKSLGGKILRVDRDGKAAPNNLGDEFDARIYSYGHRNTQGLAFYDTARDAVVGVSVEHGSTIDDEVNTLVAGNFGWDPPTSYDESGVPMTDTDKFPNAIGAIWSSGEPTQAPSGATIVNGPAWKAWDGALMVSMLKAEHLKVLVIDQKNKIVDEQKFLTSVGRLRAATQGPDGNLYVSTSNGNDDKIIRVTPK